MDPSMANDDGGCSSCWARQRRLVGFLGIFWILGFWNHVDGLLVSPSSRSSGTCTHADFLKSHAGRNEDLAPHIIDDCDDFALTRRNVVKILTSIVPSYVAMPAFAELTSNDAIDNRNAQLTAIPKPSYVTVPLKFTGQELLIYYRVDGSLFRAVVDTGSPFLMIPGSCGPNTRSKSGCYKEQGMPSGLQDTFEQFDGFEGNVEWRMAPVTLVNATGSLMTKPPLITFGVASESILGGPGGVFFGLIRDTDTWIRPSFLGQTLISSIQFDLQSSQKTLTLSQDSLIPPGQDSIRLTTDLRRKYGDPVNHYTARAQSITVNGFPLEGPGKKPIYVIFDTGVTGMVVSQELFNERYSTARQRREKNLWGHVDVSFETQMGQTVVLSADKPLTTSFDPQKTWKRFRGHLIVMGLSFLDGNRITIDIDHQSLLVERSEQDDEG